MQIRLLLQYDTINLLKKYFIEWVSEKQKKSFESNQTNFVYNINSMWDWLIDIFWFKIFSILFSEGKCKRRTMNLIGLAKF